MKFTLSNVADKNYGLNRAQIRENIGFKKADYEGETVKYREPFVLVMKEKEK